MNQRNNNPSVIIVQIVLTNLIKSVKKPIFFPLRNDWNNI